MTHLSLVSLRKDPALASVVELLIPEKGGTGHPGHHLTWSLFNRDGEDKQRREFLFREFGRGQFFVLSAVAPAPNSLLDVESRELPLNFTTGQRLSFRLRANPTVKRGNTRIDVVMRELHPIPRGQRAAEREKIIQTSTLAWLQRQGAGKGFEVDTEGFLAEGYRQERIRRRGEQEISLTTVDLSGMLTVTDPTRFADAVRTGVGSGRAYGCGLLLLR